MPDTLTLCLGGAAHGQQGDRSILAVEADSDIGRLAIKAFLQGLEAE